MPLNPLTQALFELKDDNYREFHAKLIPNVPAEKIIGVRTPALRDLRNGVKIYVQVAYLLASEETVRREFSVYDSIKDNFPKYVVSMDEFDFSRNGIIHRNIRDFLLEEI